MAALLQPSLMSGLPSREQLHRATVEGKLHSGQIRIRENAVYGVGVEDFQTQIHACRHDFRGACGLKIDDIARFLPRLDGASGSFASDFISIRDKAAAKLLGKLSKADFIAFFYKDFMHWSALVAQAPVNSKACAREVSRSKLQSRRTYSPVARLIDMFGSDGMLNCLVVLYREQCFA
jgi:hypothetical protein